MQIEQTIVDTAVSIGATVAGIGDVGALRASPSHVICTQMGDYNGVGTTREGAVPDRELFDWPAPARSVLVIGLSHPKVRPELDWWDGRGTLGNRALIDIVEKTRQWIEDDLNIATRKLAYHIEKGGVFLKDAAVLAGLGCIGRNNLLITPGYGPRIRLRALFLDAALAPTGPIAFDPCADCRVNCRKVCPEQAMEQKATVFSSLADCPDLPARDGAYDRHLCNIRMEKDIAESRESRSGKPAAVKYCRKCEFVCPVGK